LRDQRARLPRAALGYRVGLGGHGGQWICVFYEGHGGYEQLAAAGTAQAATPWGAVQRAAWGALSKETAA
jgi:hypothetical protein